MQANAIIVIVLISILGGGLAGGSIVNWYNKAGYTKTLEAALEQQKQDMDKANAAAIELEKKRAAAETKSKDTQKKLDAYLKAKLSKDCLDKEGLEIFNDV